MPRAPGRLRAQGEHCHAPEAGVDQRERGIGRRLALPAEFERAGPCCGPGRDVAEKGACRPQGAVRGVAAADRHRALQQALRKSVEENWRSEAGGSWSRHLKQRVREKVVHLAVALWDGALLRSAAFGDRIDREQSHVGGQ